MYRVRRTGSPNKLRDANIAIAYHNTGRTLQSVGDEFSVSKERVRQIHGLQVRHVNHCNGMPFTIEVYMKNNHNEKIVGYLKEYKDFLIEQGFDR